MHLDISNLRYIETHSERRCPTHISMIATAGALRMKQAIATTSTTVEAVVIIAAAVSVSAACLRMAIFAW